MNPVRHKTLVEQTARELEISPQALQPVIDFYFKSVHHKLSSAQHAAVLVPNLGVFVMKRRAVEKKIAKTLAVIHKLERSLSMQAFALLKEKRKDLENLYNAENELVKEKTRKEETKQRRKTYEKPDQSVEGKE